MVHWACCSPFETRLLGLSIKIHSFTYLPWKDIVVPYGCTHTSIIHCTAAGSFENVCPQPQNLQQFCLLNDHQFPIPRPHPQTMWVASFPGHVASFQGHIWTSGNSKSHLKVIATFFFGYIVLLRETDLRSLRKTCEETIERLGGREWEGERWAESATLPENNSVQCTCNWSTLTRQL